MEVREVEPMTVTFEYQVERQTALMVVGLAKLQRAARKAGVRDVPPIIIWIGDTPALPLGGGWELVFDPMDGLYDLWTGRGDNLNIQNDRVSMEDAVALIRKR